MQAARYLLQTIDRPAHFIRYFRCLVQLKASIGGEDFFHFICNPTRKNMAMFNPAHPGELIRETIDGIATETGKRLTVSAIAQGLGTTRKTLSAIINGKQSVTPEMALRLAAAFSNTSPEFWLRVQDNYDLFLAKNKVDTKNVRVFWKVAVL